MRWPWSKKKKEVKRDTSALVIPYGRNKVKLPMISGTAKFVCPDCGTTISWEGNFELVIVDTSDHTCEIRMITPLGYHIELTRQLNGDLYVTRILCNQHNCRK